MKSQVAATCVLALSLSFGQTVSAGDKQIMHLALEAGVLEKAIDVDEFASGDFATDFAEEAANPTAVRSGKMTPEKSFGVHP